MYYAFFEQENGCDYTIACGKDLRELTSTNMSDAEKEVQKILLESYYPGSEMEVIRVTIIESVATVKLDVESVYRNILSERERQKNEEIRARELAELERLKSKYEK